MNSKERIVKNEEVYNPAQAISDDSSEEESVSKGIP
tara:strand:- start:1359 stop:1466 length:108 start_codon:yes stop_codon:yes gene_type:complete